MLIDGVEYHINVLVLLMENEIETTIHAIETLLEGIEEGVTVSILLNGGRLKNLRELFSKHGCIRYYESETNLGVAGGRNFLLSTAECERSDIVMILDNDVVIPLDYVRNLTTFLVRQKNAGVVGAVVADIGNIPYRLVIDHFGDRGVFGNKLLKIKCADIKASLIERLGPHHLFHIGIHPDYRLAYFSLRPQFNKIIRLVFAIIKIKKDFSPILKNNTAYLNLISQAVDTFEVSTIAGCSQAFRRQLLDKIGCLNDLFNPYGFEDSEFCMRSLSAGYRNYIDVNTWLYHGTDIRHKNRDSDRACENMFKGLTIFAYLVFINPKRFRSVILKLIYFEFLFEFISSPPKAFKRMKLKLSGYHKGLQILKRQSVREGAAT